MDYRHLRAWGLMMNSAPGYIHDQVKQARKEQAPDDAVFRDKDGRWHTFDEVTRTDTRHVMLNILESIG